MTDDHEAKSEIRGLLNRESTTISVSLKSQGHRDGHYILTYSRGLGSIDSLDYGYFTHAQAFEDKFVVIFTEDTLEILPVMGN